MHQEYPKSLSMRGEWEGEAIIVLNAEEEAAKRAEGFRMIGEPLQENEAPIDAPKRTRKAKQ